MIRGKISDLVFKLEKLAQARISRTSKLLVSWNKTTNRLDAQSSFSIDYSQYSSNSIATKIIFGQYFIIYGGGVKTVIIDDIHETKTDENTISVIHESRSVKTNVFVNFFNSFIY